MLFLEGIFHFAKWTPELNHKTHRWKVNALQTCSSTRIFNANGVSLWNGTDVFTCRKNNSNLVETSLSQIESIYRSIYLSIYLSVYVSI